MRMRASVHDEQGDQRIVGPVTALEDAMSCQLLRLACCQVHTAPECCRVGQVVRAAVLAQPMRVLLKCMTIAPSNDHKKKGSFMGKLTQV